MKTIIAGSRTIRNYAVMDRVYQCYNLPITEIVSGGAPGVDRLGELLADEIKVPLTIMKAAWDLNGKAAGYIRNKEMAQYADALIAIWDGESIGTLNMIEIMRKMGKPLVVLNLKTNEWSWDNHQILHRKKEHQHDDSNT
jgi:hypothetical protein